MPKFRKPWFRPSRNTWYVELDGHQKNLGPDKDAAFEKWHQLKAEKPQPKVLKGRSSVTPTTNRGPPGPSTAALAGYRQRSAGR